jgi:hypothetical protein
MVTSHWSQNLANIMLYLICEASRVTIASLDTEKAKPHE